VDRSLRILFIFFAIAIGIYPVLYLALDMPGGLLSSKSPEVLESRLWLSAFYLHIFFGGIALLSGWSQFLKKFRNRYLPVHRALGKVYLIVVLISGCSGLYIAMYATGGLVAVTGFSGLAIGWLFTSVMAYLSILRKEVDKHQYWMIRSYALCFAAVTLRIWLPFFQLAFDFEFLIAYRIIAWLCWVPNLLVAEMIIRNLKIQKLLAKPKSIVSSSPGR